MARVLLIEPDRVLARTYTQALELAGHEVYGASNAQEAIYRADATTPDIVVLEVQLAMHNGIAFLYELRSYPEWQHIPVIINSYAAAEDFAAVKAVLTEQLGVRALHYKPQTSLQLLLRSVAEHALAGDRA